MKKSRIQSTLCLQVKIFLLRANYWKGTIFFFLPDPHVGGRIQGDRFPHFLNFLLLYWLHDKKIFFNWSAKQFVNCLTNAITQNKEHGMRFPTLSKPDKNWEIQLSIIGLNFLAFIWRAVDPYRCPKLLPLIKNNPSLGLFHLLNSPRQSIISRKLSFHKDAMERRGNELCE